MYPEKRTLLIPSPDHRTMWPKHLKTCNAGQVEPPSTLKEISATGHSPLYNRERHTTHMDTRVHSKHSQESSLKQNKGNIGDKMRETATANRSHPPLQPSSEGCRPRVSAGRVRPAPVDFVGFRRWRGAGGLKGDRTW